MQVELLEGKTGFSTSIGTQLSDSQAKCIIACLHKNTDVFAFSNEDLIGVDPKEALHCLDVDPTTKPIKQKLKQFRPEKDAVIREEVR